MPEYDFSNVEAAIVDTQGNTLRLLRDVLSRLGIKKVETYDGYVSGQALLNGGQPDLLLLDCDGPHEADAFKFVRNFRNEPETPNPYAAVIVTTWQPTQMQLTRMTGSGADDMLVKPVSPKQVLDRLALVIESRKKFVVTADYIGPDRRKSPRDGAQVPLFDVPNTLRLKTTGRWNSTNIRHLMAEAKRAIDEQKRLRASIQIAFLIEFAIPGLAKEPPERSAIEHLTRVPGVVDDLHRRLPESDVPTPAETACRAMRVLSERLRSQAEEGAVPHQDLGRLRALALELMQAVDLYRSADALTHEVQTAVNAYRARLEAMAQAKAEAAENAAKQKAGEAAAKTG